MKISIRVHVSVLPLLALCVGCEHGHDHSGPARDAAATSDASPAVVPATVDAAGTVPPAGYLLAADLQAKAIHAFRLPDLALTGTIQGVLVGNHVGAIALEDGRVITTDDDAKEVIAIKMDAQGRPAIVNRAKATIGNQAVWACADARLTHLAVASQLPGTEQITSIVRLDDFTVSELPSTMKEAGELHAYLAGEPLNVFVGVGGEVQAFPLELVKAKAALAPVSTVAVGASAHGPVVAHGFGRLYLMTNGTMTGVDYGSTPLRAAKSLPWDADTRSTGRNGRPRLSWDGRYIYGAIANAAPAEAEKWAEREIDFHAADLMTETARRWKMTTGIVPKFQLSAPYALFANISGAGDFAILVDVNSASPTYQQVAARVPLSALTTGPKVGEPTTGRESRASAITPDGRWAFVSHGGEGKISVIDTATKSVAAMVSTPTPLRGGGYLFAVQPGTKPVDTCTR